MPIEKDSQKCFKFLYKGQLYKFICLPNGFVHGPRKFTKLLKPPLAFLRRLKHILAGYIDDIINVGDDFSDCLKNVADTIMLLNKLGFVVHPDKSQFLPVQEIKFLGFIINSNSMTIRLTDEKKENLGDLCLQLLKEPKCIIRRLASVLGKITSSMPGVKYGPLYYRHLEHDKCQALRNKAGNFDAKMIISEKGLVELQWWKNNIKSSYKDILYSEGVGRLKMGWRLLEDLPCPGLPNIYE